MKTTKTEWFAVTALLNIALMGGCSDQSNNTSPPETPVAQPTAPTAPIDELSPTSPKVVYALGWASIEINANYAKTIVSIGSHFTTNRNACGKDAYGAIELDTWNSLAKNANLALQQPPREDTYCVDPPTDTYKYMDGTVEIKTISQDSGSSGNDVNNEHGLKSRALFEVKDGQICSTIADKAVSDALLAAINKIIVIADKEDCPNGWGS